MLDLQDIRTGNQVLHSASGATTTVVKVENKRVLLDTFPESSYYSNAEISGIALTTSILQQLLFTNDDNQNTWQGQGISITLKPDGFFYGLRISKSRAKIEYLHQLQNYISDFYAMFREEKYSLNLSSLYSK